MSANSPRVRVRMRVAGIIVAACMLASAPAAWAQAGTGVSRRFDYSRAPDQVVVRYSEVAAELESHGAGRSVTIYGDGRVVSQYPAYMKRAGSHTSRLDARELDALVAELVDADLVEHDSDRLRGRRAQLDAARSRAPGSTLYEVSDETIIALDLDFARYRARGAPASADARARKRIDYRGLRADAVRYPELDEVQKLARATKQLRAVMQRAVAESSAGATASE